MCCMYMRLVCPCLIHTTLKLLICYCQFMARSAHRLQSCTSQNSVDVCAEQLRRSQMLDMWPRGFLPCKCPGGRSLSPVPVEPRCDTPISQQTAVWVAHAVSTWQNDRPLLLPLISVADHGQPSHQDSRPKPHGEIQQSSDSIPFPFLYLAKYPLGWKVLYWPWPLRQRGLMSHYIYGLLFIKGFLKTQMCNFGLKCKNLIFWINVLLERACKDCSDQWKLSHVW